MRLVKGARRRSLAIAAVFSVAGASACSDAPKPGTAMDCAEVLNRPRDPRIVAVNVDGTLEPGPRLDSAAAVAGFGDSFAWRVGNRIHVTLGARAFDVDAPAASHLHASESLRGVMLGEHVVALDKGGLVELHGLDGSIRTTAVPALPAGASLGSPTLIAGGVLAYVGDAPRAGEKRRLLVPFDPPPPPGSSWPAIDGRSHAGAGFIAPGERGAVIVDGKRTELGVPVFDTDSVIKLDDDWLVIESARHATFVQPGRAPLDVDPKNVELHVFPGGIYEVVKHPTPSIAILQNGAWSTVMGGDPTRDLSGAALPRGAVVVRIEAAVHDGVVLAIERVQQETCTLDDRVFLVDVARRSAKVVASGGDKMRIHPLYAGERFRFVEADVDSSLP